MYFERQQLQQCLRHALNNLFQRPLITTQQLNEIADSIASPGILLGPHRTRVFGNYDANVLQLAAQQNGVDVQWYDTHKDPEMQHLGFQEEEIFGIILNVASTSWLGRLMRGRHWKVLKPFGGVWYIFDSQLPQPERLNAELLLVASDSNTCTEDGPKKAQIDGEEPASAQMSSCRTDRTQRNQSEELPAGNQAMKDSESLYTCAEGPSFDASNSLGVGGRAVIAGRAQSDLSAAGEVESVTMVRQYLARQVKEGKAYVFFARLQSGCQ